MRTGKIYIAVIFLNAVLALQAQGADDKASDMKNESAVVAYVGGEKIAIPDVLYRLKAQRLNDASSGRLDSFLPDAKEKTVGNLVDVKLFSLGARDNGLDQRPDIKRRIRNITEEILAQEFITVFTEKVPMSEDALQDYYEKHTDEFMAPGKVRARHIVVKSQSEADGIFGELKKGADFAELAKDRNVDSTQQAGGELGWVVKGIMVKPFEDALFSLKQGEISPVVQTFMGFHIIQVEEVRKGDLPVFESVRNSVKGKIIEARVKVLRDELIKKYPVKINMELLNTTD